MYGSQFLLNCTDLNVTQLKTINMARSVAGAICTIMVGSILVYILVKKAIQTVLQRLYLYLVLATIVQEALIGVSFERQFQYKGQDELCTVYGFAIQWSGVIMFYFALGIMVYLLYLVYKHVKGELFHRITTSKSAKRCAECSYILFILLFPLTYLWVPFVHGNYGLSGASCWMRALDENCTNVGLADQLIFAYGAYEGVGCAAILVSIVISIIYCRVASRYPDARTLIKRTLSLTTFLIAYVVIISIPLAVRLLAGITGSRQHFILWMTWAVAIPISHTIFIFGFLLSFYSIKLCNFRTIKTLLYSCVKTSSQKPNNTHTIEENTIPPSDRVSQPSQTYFSVPYTGDFTDVDPLLRKPEKDTGYSSVTECS